MENKKPPVIYRPETWQEAKELTKIPRLNWKHILGMSMNKFVMEKVKEGHGKEEIIHFIMLKARAPYNEKYVVGWSWEAIARNVKIGVSARYAELKIYGKR